MSPLLSGTSQFSQPPGGVINDQRAQFEDVISLTVPNSTGGASGLST
jgi:hypothetical protein